MTITVKHKFVSAIPDEADATIVRPSNWNDDHQLVGTVPIANGGTGAADAPTALTNLGAYPASNPNGYGTGTVTSVTGTSPVVSSGGATPAISMPAATTSVSGYLTNTDWTTFNNKSNTTGTVTSVGTTGAVNGLTLTGGPITGSGTVTLGGTLDLSSPPTIGNTTPSTGAFTTLKANSELVNQSYDQGTGVLQVTGASSFNGAVVDKSLNLQGGNNLLTYSQDFTNAAWSKTSSGVSIPTITSGVSDPLGGTNAQSISFPATSSSTYYSILTQQYTGTVATYCRSMWVRATTAGDVGKTFYYFANTGSNIDVKGVVLTSSYQRVQSAYTGTAGANQTLFGSIGSSYGGSNQSAFSADVAFNQAELGSVASAYTPTTTAAVTTTNNINVPSGQVLAQSGSVSLPSFSYLADPSSGFRFNSTSYGTRYVAHGTDAVALTSTGFGVTSTGRYAFSADTNPEGGDTFLYRDAANTLAQRNSTNAQAFRLYNSYTSSTSYENLQFDWTTTANTATISTQKGSGGGTARTLAIGQPLVISPGYTVATLPAGVIGMRAYVTDALAPIYLGTLTGGGAIKCPVFYNGTAWVSA